MSRKKIVFVGFDNDYEIIGIKSLECKYDIEFVSVNKTVRKIIKRLSLSEENFCKTLSKIVLTKLSIIKGKDLVIFKDEVDYFSSLHRYVGKHILMLRNTIDDEFFLKKVKCPVYSFDKMDCDKYNLRFYHQYSPVISMDLDIDFGMFDIVFVGRDKNRNSILNSISHALSDYKIKIYLFGGKDKKSLIGRASKKNLSYVEYLKLQLSGKVVLDIVQEGQSSETMRLIEALSFNRKVITNNVSVLSHPLYKPENILYLSDFSDISDISDRVNEFLSLDFDNYQYDEVLKFSSSFILDKIIKESIEL
ncbi:hypothetical protein ACVYF0_17315 [Vibrio cholerae]